MKLILASSSKNRQDLFKMVGLKYEVVKSTIEEHSDATDPKEYVKDLSRDKANSVAEQINEKAIIIAADTVIYMDGKIFEKPKDKKEAYETMKSMSGKVTYGVTGITIKDLYKDKEITFADTAEVHFKEISDEDIKWYIENDKYVLQRCGYSIMGKAAFFIDKVVGDYNTVFGISLSRVYSKLQELGYSLSDFELEK